MKSLGMAVLMAGAAMWLLAAPLSAQTMGQGQVVVTVLPKVEGQPLPSSVTITPGCPVMDQKFSGDRKAGEAGRRGSPRERPERDRKAGEAYRRDP